MFSSTDPEIVTKLALSVLVAGAMTAGIVVAVLEWRWLRGTGRLGARTIREMLLSLSVLPPNALVATALAPAWYAVYVTASEFALWQIGHAPVAILAAFLAADFSYYLEHRCAHKVRPLWRLYHAIHHSSDRYTVATAYRISFLTQLLSPAFYIPWILLGFDPLLIAGFSLFAFHYQAWIHTEMVGSLGPLDTWLNTPANHRIHHSRDPAHRDRNFGAVLMVWDRLLGSYCPPAPRVDYGIPGAAPPATAIALYTDHWHRSRSGA